MLTANHVTSKCNLLVVTAQGKPRIATVVRSSKKHDVSLLRVPNTNYLRPRAITAPPPEVGQWVCLVPAVPRPDRRCGRRVHDPERIRHTAITQPGNSGSGVYDDRGRLIGIVTHLTKCTNGQICGGIATSLHSRLWLLTPG